MFAVLAAAARSAGEDGSLLQAGSTPNGPTKHAKEPKHPSCSFSINITDASGAESEPDRSCFLCSRSCYSGPATISNVSGTAADKVVVWDSETGICDEGQLYIHQVGSGAGAAGLEMTAGAGPIVHLYKACAFDTLPVSGTGCQTFSGDGCRVNLGDCADSEWKVGRDGSSC